MTTKLEKMAKQINDSFGDHLAAKFKERFGLEISTSYNLLIGMMSERKDGKFLTPDQLSFIKAFEYGYLAAMNQVHE